MTEKHFAMAPQRRRHFLLGAIGVGVTAAACSRVRRGELRTASNSESSDISPPEDLMREHGVLNRILLVYEACAARLDDAKVIPADALSKSAQIVHDFIEQYHEKLEEDYVFPRFEHAGKLVELVATLRRQHLAGRSLTDSIRQLTSTTATTEKESDRKRLVSNLRAFIRMYRPHEAWEDTVLSPNFRSVVNGNEMRELGERFEDTEHALFGKAGFEGIVGQVEAIERQLNLHNLDQFTPT